MGTHFLGMVGTLIVCALSWRSITLRTSAKAALGAADAGITLVLEIMLSDVIDGGEFIGGGIALILKIERFVALVRKSS